ncbi:MAG: hypothetical protein AN484_27405, partial [Aphanizomenon flos-aquae WA102]
LPVMARLYEDAQNPREEAVKPPRFNGTYTDYPIFKREWAGYQQQMLPHWSERDVAKRLVADGLCKSAKTGVERFQHLDRIWSWLDRRYDHPRLALEEILGRVTRLGNPAENDHRALCEYYLAILTATMEAESSGVEDALAEPEPVRLMSLKLPPKELVLWVAHEAEAPIMARSGQWLAFVEERRRFYSSMYAMCPPPPSQKGARVNVTTRAGRRLPPPTPTIFPKGEEEEGDPEASGHPAQSF